MVHLRYLSGNVIKNSVRFNANMNKRNERREAFLQMKKTITYGVLRKKKLFHLVNISKEGIRMDLPKRKKETRKILLNNSLQIFFFYLIALKYVKKYMYACQ